MRRCAWDCWNINLGGEMTKAAKKMQRKVKKAKKRLAETELKEKISMFSKLENSCLTCEKPFDKQNKEMVQSWYVVVRKGDLHGASALRRGEDRVNLYCPECWSKASNIVVTDDSKWTSIDWEKIKEEINAEKS